MFRTRRLLCLLALILALPTAAFAQGAGDDQYQDPFAEEPTAQQDQPPDLGDEPPGGGDTGGGGGTTTPAPPTDPAPQGPTGGDSSPNTDNALPLTGSDPRPLLLIGAAFLLGGIGLRLRTIDPNDF